MQVPLSLQRSLAQLWPLLLLAIPPVAKHMRVQEVSNSLWALATARPTQQVHPMQPTQPSPGLTSAQQAQQPQQVQQVQHVIQQAQQAQHATQQAQQAAIHALSARGVELVRDMDRQHLCNIAWACAKLDYRCVNAAWGCMGCMKCVVLHGGA